MSFVVTSLYIVFQYIATINLTILRMRTLTLTKVTQYLGTAPVRLLLKKQLAHVTCKNFNTKLNRETRKKQKVKNTAAKKKAPISITNPQQIKLTLREHRLKFNQLQEEIYVMENEINKKNYSIDNELTQVS